MKHNIAIQRGMPYIQAFAWGAGWCKNSEAHIELLNLLTLVSFFQMTQS